MSIPAITTAIPKRRYQLGEFIITVLGEVQSSDGLEYRWVAGVARESEPKPALYVSAERNTEQPGQGALRLRVSMGSGEQVLGYGDEWRNLDTFVEQALHIVSTMLELSDETPHRLL